MASSEIHAVPAPASFALSDSVPTVCAVAALAIITSTLLHEGLGHACIALLTVSPSGVLSTLAWDSAYDSRLVDAGGTLVNLAAAAVFWLLLRATAPNSNPASAPPRASAATRLYLLLACAFNLFAGTGYFLFSGVTNFGDWAGVIDGLPHHALWRVVLIVGGALAFWAALVVAGTSLIRDCGFARTDRRRITRLMLAAYFTAVAVSCIAGLLNPLGPKYVLLSALPATAGAGSGLLYMQHYARKNVRPLARVEPINRSFPWLIVSAACVLVFITVFGRGIQLAR